MFHVTVSYDKSASIFNLAFSGFACFAAFILAGLRRLCNDVQASVDLLAFFLNYSLIFSII